MAPTKPLKTKTASTNAFTFGKKSNIVNPLANDAQNCGVANNVRSKRKADNSPLRNDRVKRSALGNLTNAVVKLDQPHPQKRNVSVICENKQGNNAKIPLAQISEIENIPNARLRQSKANVTKVVPATKIVTRAAVKNAVLCPPPAPLPPLKSKANVNAATAVKLKDELPGKASKSTRRISNDFEKSEESLYVSALEDISSGEVSRITSFFESKEVISQETVSSQGSLKATQSSTSSCSSTSASFITSSDAPENDLIFLTKQIPDSVIDFDKENWNDTHQVSHYAMDIFNYLRFNEYKYKIDDYIEKQPELTKWMRSLLVDWMVEVQESFELNHETLYLAVKIVDKYLSKVKVSKEMLQLLGAASLLIACKFDERTPPLIEDFLYICDGAYKQPQLLKMEISVFKTIEFDLGFPLSYRFLRRYARCGKVSMMTLTLARYILEYTLMDYSIIQISDSKLACAALFIALRMNCSTGWDSTFEHYSSYKLEDFAPAVILLNSLLHRKPKETLNTVRNKYSHKIFHQVTKIPLMDTQKLFENVKGIQTNVTYPSIVKLCGPKNSSA